MKNDLIVSSHKLCLKLRTKFNENTTFWHRNENSIEIYVDTFFYGINY